MASIYAIDLFCGAGGLTHGFERAGIPVTVGYDIDPVCQFPFEYNNAAKFISQNVELLTGHDLEEHRDDEDLKILAGCAPCQPFSTYSRRYNGKEKEHGRWEILKDFTRLVEEFNPDIISIENVLQLKQYAIFQEFLKKLNELGYSTTQYDVDCQFYGVPQTRKRLVLFASKIGKIKLIPPTHSEKNYVTVRETIGQLEPLDAGQVSQTDNIHCCSRLSALNLQRIRASKPGGTWRDWDRALIAQCHAKDSGKTYPSVYGRMEWDLPSPTLTTQCFGYGNGRFGHPEQDRAISLREAALLQTFPIDYQFVPSGKPIMFAQVGRLIGNAVPVKLGEAVARSIINHVEGNS